MEKERHQPLKKNIPSLDLEALERINEVNFQVAIERLLVDVHQRPAKKLHAVDRDDLVDIHVEHEKDDGKEEDVNLVLDEGNLVEIVVDQDEDLHKKEDEGISAKNDNVFIEEVVEDETHVGKESDMEEVVEEKREEIAEENRVDLQEEIEATVGREHLTNIDINLVEDISKKELTVVVGESPLEVRPISEQPNLLYHLMWDIDEYRDEAIEEVHNIDEGSSRQSLNDDDLQLVETPLLEIHTKDWHDSIRKLKYTSFQEDHKKMKMILCLIYS
nr:hypothetical protein Iba_chr11bCG9410 [Ipomoea batatas]